MIFLHPTTFKIPLTPNIPTYSVFAFKLTDQGSKRHQNSAKLKFTLLSSLIRVCYGIVEGVIKCHIYFHYLPY